MSNDHNNLLKIKMMAQRLFLEAIPIPEISFFNLQLKDKRFYPNIKYFDYITTFNIIDGRNNYLENAISVVQAYLNKSVENNYIESYSIDVLEESIDFVLIPKRPSPQTIRFKGKFIKDFNNMYSWKENDK